MVVYSNSNNIYDLWFQSIGDFHSSNGYLKLAYVVNK